MLVTMHASNQTMNLAIDAAIAISLCDKKPSLAGIAAAAPPN
jgi:hypothetical protein